MTFLQPNKSKNFFIRLIVGLTIPFIGGVFWLVVMYNQVVTAEHEISKINKQIEESQALNADLKEQAFAFFSGDNIEKLIFERGLVQEKNHQYFEDFSSQQKIISANLR